MGVIDTLLRKHGVQVLIQYEIAAANGTLLGKIV